MSYKSYVLDTGLLVSALLCGEESLPAQSVAYTIRTGVLLASDATLAELTDVLQRPKFDACISIEKRLAFLQQYIAAVQLVEISEQLEVCRDPKDDKFLSLAVDGMADYILTGDADLLVLHPFRGVPILTSRAFLAEVG